MNLKMRYVKCVMATLAIVAEFSMASAAGAETLALDFQPTDGMTEPGFLAFEETNEVVPDGNGGTDYTAFGSTVNISLATANLPDGASDFRAVARDGAAEEKENDWLGSDTREMGMDVGLTVTVSGLPAGRYAWLSTHHDGGSNATNGNLDGTTDLEFIDADGTTGLMPNAVTVSTQNEGDPISRYSRAFRSDGAGDIVFSVVMDEGQGGDNALFALVNSVEITNIPEPSSLAMLAFCVMGLVFGRWR